MRTMHLNWKRSLALVALLVVFNGPEATVAVAQSNKPESPSAPEPELAPAAPADSGANPEATEAPRAPKPPPPPAAEDSFRRRYGLSARPAPAIPGRPVRQAERLARGSKLEAKLKQMVLPEVAFDGLPLGEVLRFLSDESVKRDPEETGVNFLIKPNFSPAAHAAKIDPATGLAVAVATEQFDMASVVVKFNLPLRHVTMKNVLDAIVTVADHPIEYSLEEYAVVFSAKTETVAGQPVAVAHPEMVPAPGQAFSPIPRIGPMVILPPTPPGRRPEPPERPHRPGAELKDVKPRTFNIDFGSGAPSEQVGPAAAGRAGDFWNTVSVGFNDHHTESDLKFAGGDPSPIEVEMINLGGGWHSDHTMGVKSPMYNTYNYPTGNRGGNSTVILHHVPPGNYNVYIYGHGPNPIYYGDYTLTVGTHDYGRKQTSHKMDSIQNTKWVEGSQYVKYLKVEVGEGEEIEILIQPGARVTDPSGRSFADAMICGLQLIPVSRPGVTAKGDRAQAGRARGARLPAGLVGWWPGEGDASDVTGHNPGTLRNGASFAPGKVGRAFDLNGTSQYVDVPDSDSLNPTQCITVEAWIYPQLPLDPVAAPIIKKAGGGGPWGQDNGYALELLGPEEVRFGVCVAENETWNITESAPLAPDKWSHVAGVYDGTHVSFYFNGELVGAPLSASGRIMPSHRPLQIGHDASNPERYFHGLIDEARVYNTALSAAQIQASYKGGSAGKRRPAR